MHKEPEKQQIDQFGSLRRIFALIIKELLGIWRDPRSRFAILSPPVIQLLIFTFAATLDVKNATLGILNRDNGEQGFELVQRFHGAPTFKHLIYLQAVEEVGPFLDNQRGIAVISLDEQFSRNLDAGHSATVQLLLDGRKTNTAQIVTGYATTLIERFNDDLMARNDLPEQNVALVPRNWFNPNILYYWYNVPSLVAILSMLTCLIVTSISVARERELGTFDQLLVSPLQPVEILVGKLVPGIIIGLLEGTLIVLVGVFLFRVPFTGSFLIFYFSLFIFVCAISGVGLFISSLCSTQQQAILGTFVFMVPSVILSGFATPIENMPIWLQPVTNIIPLKYMLIISKGVFLKAMPPMMVLGRTWPLALIGLVTVIGAGLFFRRRIG